MYKFIVFLTAAVIAAGVPLSQIQLVQSYHLPSDLSKISLKEHAGQDSMFDDLVHELSAAQSPQKSIQEVEVQPNAQVFAETDFNDSPPKEEERQDQADSKSNSNEYNKLIDSIRRLLETGSQSQESPTSAQIEPCVISQTIVNEIRKGETNNQYIVFNNNYVMHGMQDSTKNINWTNAYSSIERNVTSEEVLELWFTYVPDHNAVERLANTIFDKYKNKPTFYISHLAPPEANLRSCVKRVSCLQKLVNDGYTLKEWDWNIFLRFHRIPACQQYIDNSTDSIDLEQKLFKIPYLNAIEPNRDLGNLCSTD